MDEETTRMLKFLRFSGLLAHWDEYMALAQKQGFSHVRLLKHVLEQECTIKSENARRLRLQRAAIPVRYVMETYPFDRQPKLDKKKILALYDAFDYVAKSRNIIFVGPPDSTTLCSTSLTI
jgi:DNA replication protein DnaC